MLHGARDDTLDMNGNTLVDNIQVDDTADNLQYRNRSIMSKIINQRF